MSSSHYPHQEETVADLQRRGDDIGVEWAPQPSRWTDLPPEWIFDYAEVAQQLPHGKAQYVQPIVQWNFNQNDDWMVYDDNWYLKLRYAGNVAQVWKYLHRQLASLGPLVYLASGSGSNVKSKKAGSALDEPSTEYHFEWVTDRDDHGTIDVQYVSVAPVTEVADA